MSCCHLSRYLITVAKRAVAVVMPAGCRVVVRVLLMSATLVWSGAAVGPALAAQASGAQTPSAEAAGAAAAFRQALATAAAPDRDMAAFYRDRRFAPLWTGRDAASKARLRALFAAIETAPAHGLPAARYDAAGLLAQMRAVDDVTDLGRLEARISRSFLMLARDLDAGLVVPGGVDDGIKRVPEARDRASYLPELAAADTPRAFIRGLAPDTNEYRRLMKEKMRLERLVAAGGWGPSVPARRLEPGSEGAEVVALRDRLIAMGYLKRSVGATYDARLRQAVLDFQLNHGLKTDGVAGPSTMAKINVTAETRLKSVIVALERERWLPEDRGARHILVNLTDFAARIVDDDVVTFRTRAVVGMNAYDRRTPEFSDRMEHMVINPTWHVPRSITVNEYLPQMQTNRNAASHLRLYDAAGRPVSRARVNFNAYTANTFPFSLKQPPSRENALGLVKFMFPNKYNIYLHDTPSKHLFDRETRDFSHGCIRLQQPFEFAYRLLSRQTDDPQGYFHSVLNTGREATVPLDTPVPVHLIYRTAYTVAGGRTQFRADVYGRDDKIWQALSRAGVSVYLRES